MKIGEVLTLQIEELSPRGHGVARANGEELSVQGTLPGDRIQVRVIRRQSGKSEGRVVKMEEPGPDRVSARCRHFGPCGGCSLQHMGYPAQTQWKRMVLEETLRREGGITRLPDTELIPMEDPWAYRNKMEFTFGQEADRITLGFHERGSFQRIVDIVRCEIAPPQVSRLLEAVKRSAQRSGLKSYNPKIHQGFWRYAVVRASQTSGELMLVVVTNDGPAQPLEEMAREIPREVPELKSIYWGVSTKVSDVASAERLTHLAGLEFLEDRVGELKFEIGPTEFIQPNLTLAARVYEAIRARAGLTGREAVYDLYCGIGLIALALAAGARVVYGVESDRKNVDAAQRNAQLNGISNAVFLWGRLEDLLKNRALFRTGPRPEVVVLDPPRAGLHPEVYGPLLEAGVERLLYLSCNPASLARDLKVLRQRDPRLTLESVQLFDFFPHTFHMEVLVSLRRAPH